MYDVLKFSNQGFNNVSRKEKSLKMLMNGNDITNKEIVQHIQKRKRRIVKYVNKS